MSSEEYEDFTEKFKPKLTTDDCYTPPLVYEAVKDWAIKEYGLDGVEVMRPFYPGGDYAKESYGTDCVVIDNPPFSILSEICRFYMKHNVRFFLFAPSLTLFSTARGECNYLPLGADVTYENGAVVSTSFITNLGDWKINTAPSLTIAINEAMAKTKEKNEAAELPQYEYPSEVVTPAKLATLAGKGANIKIKHAAFIRALASQREKGAAIFGGGMLISTTDAEKAAAEKAAAEKAKIIWELSDEEREIIARLADAP